MGPSILEISRYYVDMALPFSLRSAPSIFTAIADTVQQMATHNHGVDFLQHYLNDFLTLGLPASPVCYNNMQACIQLCSKLSYRGPLPACPSWVLSLTQQLYKPSYHQKKEREGRWADERFCRRLELKGLKIGTTYNNDRSAKMFTQAIADTERAMVKTEIEDSKFSSLLRDGGTDLSVTENKIVYVRVCKQGTISVKFIRCMSTENGPC